MTRFRNGLLAGLLAFGGLLATEGYAADSPGGRGDADDPRRGCAFGEDPGKGAIPERRMADGCQDQRSRTGSDSADFRPAPLIAMIRYSCFSPARAVRS